jgi:hypothetical protein
MARTDGTVPGMRTHDATISMRSSIPHAAGAVSSARESRISIASMSGALRVAYEGAWYHVLNRGAGRRAMFQSDDQRHVFLALLGDMTAPLASKSTCIVS